MPITSTHLFYAGLLALAVAGVAGMLRLLSLSGALAAFAIGFVVFGFGGAPLAVPLLAFFLTSSLLSLVGRARKARAVELHQKTSRRDAWQVLANGAVPAALAVVFWRNGAIETWLMALGALAAVNADTWATELGTLWRGRPRLLSTWKPVEAGTSGAISALGLGAALAGSALVAFAGWLAWPPHSLSLVVELHLPEVLVTMWAGFLAAFADSILGASVQARYRCACCQALTEGAEHCGKPAQHVGGWAWVNNDVVNLAASVLGAVFVAALLAFVMPPP